MKMVVKIPVLLILATVVVTPNVVVNAATINQERRRDVNFAFGGSTTNTRYV